MASTKLVVDPIPRIEGHLKIEVEIENGVVKDAWSSGTLFRGFEMILENRDPRDVWHLVQRVCGVCPVSHGHVSSMGFENTWDVSVPDNARIIRNLIEGGQFLHSHILWFYHLTAIDYVDVVSAVSAQPKEKSLQDVHAKLKSFVDSGQLGPFANGYWGHPAYKLPPDLNLLAVAHYLEAIEMQAEAAKLVAHLGGKMPMHMSTPPGGVTVNPSVNTLEDFYFSLKKLQAWIDNVFLTDVMAIAPYYLDWAGIGKGVGNYLAWGVFDDASMDPKKRTLPRGAVFAEDLKAVDVKQEEVQEHVTHSWYNGTKQHPFEGMTEDRYTEYNRDRKYSWVKAPRINDKPMEVGALSRMLVAYLSGNGTVKKLIDSTLSKLGVPGNIPALQSVLGRAAARALETKYIADEMEKWVLELIENVKTGKNEFFKEHEMKDGQGVGLWEAPRGALAHWNIVKNEKTEKYQLVVPSTWNASPRDEKGVRGPMEEALVGTPVVDAKKPVEILRVVHSFDPCLACGVHVIDPQTNEVHEFAITP